MCVRNCVTELDVAIVAAMCISYVFFTTSKYDSCVCDGVTV